MGYTLLAYNVVRQSITGPADPALIVFGGPPGGQLWLVTGISVASTAASSPVALVYDQALPGAPGPLPPEFSGVSPVPCDGTLRGTLDFDDRNSALVVADTLSVLWLPALEAGEVAACRVQYQVVQPDASQAKNVLTA